MADEREDRKDAAPKPTKDGGPPRYPPLRPDDGIDSAGESRSFDPGRAGPGADPAEGKRD